MARRTVRLTEGAYSRLAALKREGESFNDVVDRITNTVALLGLAGVLETREAGDLGHTKKDLGKRLHKGIDRHARR